jgi:hypothetical protein
MFVALATNCPAVLYTGIDPSFRALSIALTVAVETIAFHDTPRPASIES